MNRDMYMLVAEKCIAYSSLFESKSGASEFVSCITCENFRCGICSLNYYDIVATNIRE